MQISNENRNVSTKNTTINEISLEQAQNTTVEIIPESYETMTTIHLELTEDQISTTNYTMKPSLSNMNLMIPFLQTTIVPNTEIETKKEDINMNSTIIFQPSQISST